MDYHIYPPLESKIGALILAAKSQGLIVDIFQGYRSWDDQDALYAKGRTKPGKIVTQAKGGQSWHNFGLAADVVFKVNGKWSWDDSLPWDKLGEIGKTLGLEWGGDWGSKDLDHFQWKMNFALADARTFYQHGGLKEVWDHL